MRRASGATVGAPTIQRALALAVIALALFSSRAVVRAQSAADGFDPGADGAITALAVQADGKILVVGDFTHIGGAMAARSHVGPRDTHGSLLGSLDSGADAAMGMASAAATPAPQQTFCTSNITIGTIFVNGLSTTTLVGDTMTIRVAVTSACQTQTVVAGAFGHSVALSFDSGVGAWTGSFPLAADPHTPFTLTITATDINSTMATRTKDLIHDTPPVVAITLPTPSSVARPLLHITAACTDDDLAGCVSMTVSAWHLGQNAGPVVVSGTQIDQDVSLAAFDGQVITLAFEARDTRGQGGFASRTVYVESSPLLAETTHVSGQILDDSPDRTLFSAEDCCLSLLDKGTAQITPLLPSGVGANGFVTEHGAIFTASPSPPTEALFEMRDGVLTTLDQQQEVTDLHVTSNYAIWVAGAVGSASLFRRELQAGTTASVATPPPPIGNLQNDVASNGDVVFWKIDNQFGAYQTYAYRGGMTTPLTSSNARNIYPTTDGINVAYQQKDINGALLTTRLITAGGEEILADFNGWSHDARHPGDYALDNGWTAFTKPGGADINVWLRAPDGTQTQASFLGGESQVDALNGDGSVTIRNGTRLFVKIPGQPLTDIALATSTRSFWRNNELFVIIGASAFKVNLQGAPFITGHPSDQIVPAGQMATLRVTAVATTTVSYQWYVGLSGETTNPIGGATESSYTTPPVTTTTTYWVRVSDAYGNTDSNAATVTVGVPPTIATQPHSQAIAAGESRTLGVAASGTPPFSYQWYLGTSGDTANPIGGATASSYTTPALMSTTSYWVRVSNPYGTADSATATLTVSPAAFSDDPLVAGVTLIKAVHVAELRARIDAFRARYGFPAWPYSNPTPTAGVRAPSATDILELRAALNQAYDIIGATHPAYSTPPAPGAPMTIAEINELRSALRAIE